MIRPLAAHKWEEQFRNTGDRTWNPPVEEISKRIELLLAAIEATDNETLKKSYDREVRWRRVQLERIRDVAEQRSGS